LKPTPKSAIVFVEVDLGYSLIKRREGACLIDRLGDEGVIWALIQQGNVGSAQTVGKYLKQFISDRIITDSKGAIRAGVGVSELYRFRTLHIRHMPWVLNVLNSFLRIVPSDGITKELLLSKMWHAPGGMQAAKYLFETIRWRWREKASLLIVWADKGNPVLEALNLRPWTPVTKSAVVIDSPEAMSTSRLVYYD